MSLFSGSCYLCGLFGHKASECSVSPPFSVRESGCAYYVDESF
jgi:hypothetical protein